MERQADPNNSSTGSYNKRLRYAKMLDPVLREAGKPVAVTDIANKPGFMYTRTGSVFYPVIASGALLSLVTDPMTALIGAAEVHIGYTTSHMYMNSKRRGIFNPDIIPKLDKYIPDFEQARRLFFAKGIEQLTTEYPPRQGQETPQIVALYPKAHSMRMEDILVNPRPYLDKAKSFLYKTLGPTLDYSVRTFQWKDSLEQLAASGYRFTEPFSRPIMGPPSERNAPRGGWQKISDRKIHV